jgi:hypothetical protein
MLSDRTIHDIYSKENLRDHKDEIDEYQRKFLLKFQIKELYWDDNRNYQRKEFMTKVWDCLPREKVRKI